MRRRISIVTVFALLVATAAVAIASDPSSADQNEGGSRPLVDAQRLVAVGGLHTCAVMDDGVVRCWGDNANGQLGNGTRAASTEPTPVNGVSDAVAITAGNTHTCVLHKNATVSCWGLNSNGQLGVDAVAVNSSTTPVPVPGLTNVRAIGAGGFHNCALLDTGGVRCWGLDAAGQLGDGGGTPAGDSSSPVDVVGITDATSVAAGEFHTCALRANGGVSCWGHNGFGQLGNGTNDDATTPVDVTGLPDGDKRARAIAAGYGHACAVVDDGDPDVDKNTIRCWGSNNQGQLGDGVLDGDDKPVDRNEPFTVRFDEDPSVPNYDYVDFEGADVITAGQQHTCARTVDGGAWCWGNAGRGQIGNGTRGEGDVNIFVAEHLEHMWRTPQPASVGPVDALTAGGFHTCAVETASMQCWGYNFYGQLGGYRSSSAVPVTVTALQAAASVTTGTDAAGARVVVPGSPDTHKPVCWGSNAHGELGAALANPPTADTTVAVQVQGLADVTTIDAGNGHACALPVGSGSPLCWGNNDDGQLGNGGTADAGAPVAVAGLTTATSLSAGGRSIGPEIAHTCARLQGGTVQCWGENGDGQLGDNSPAPTQATSPVTVLHDADPAPPDADDDHFDPQPLTNVVQVAAGGTHTCALRDDGTTTVWCWGRNFDGQLGDDTTTERRLATQVELIDDPDHDPPVVYLTGVSAVTAGERHTCALMAGAEAGRVRCWGDNTRGQLGNGILVDRHLPTLVPSIPFGSGDHRNPAAVALTAGTSHTCAVMDNASARCWGDNTQGQLGHGGGSFSSSPVTPVGLDNDTADTIRAELSGTGLPDDLVTSLSAGRRNTCASLIDMTVSCWGSNAAGQLGDGLGPTLTTPISVGHLDEGINGNSSPAAAEDTASTDEDMAVETTVTANDSDGDGDSLTLLQVKDPANGTASVSGDAVRYTPDLDFCGVDTVSYRIFDGRNGVADGLLTVTVTCVNDAPDAVEDVALVAEDGSTTIPVLDNDTDPDIGDSSIVVSVTSPAHGTATIVPGGVAYTPDPNYSGLDSFSYLIHDLAGSPDSASVSLTVTPGNDPPVAVDDAATTPEDTSIVVPVLANDTDVDGDALSVSSLTQPPNGTAEVVPGGIKYTPAADHTGADSFGYVVADGQGGSDAGLVSLTVGGVNDAPVANDDVASTTKDVVITIAVLANDTDADGDSLSVSSVTQPNHGSTQIESGGVKYTPAPGYSGPDAFTYVATDAAGTTDSATVNITVGPGNFAPFAGDDMASLPEDGSVTVAVLTNDFDSNGDTLLVTSVTQPAHGTATIEGNVIRYTPVPNRWGPDTFTYVVSDGTATDTAAVTMTVHAVPDAPVAGDDAASTPEDAAVTVAVLANDHDADGEALSVSSVTPPAHGSVSIVPGGVRYTPAPNFTGSDAFTYTVSDGHGGSDAATASLTITPVNDAPTLDVIPDQVMPWGATLASSATGHDVDGDPLTYSLVSAPPFAAIDNDGLLTLTPAAADVGVRTITARVTDGAVSADRSFLVTVAKQATAIVYTGATTGQYSDPASASARLTALAGAPVSGAVVDLTVGGQSVVRSSDGDGRVSGSVVLASVPGPSNAVASYGGSSAYEPSSVSVPFTITPEDAVVRATGPGLVTTTGTSAAATLTAVVEELGSDGAPGSFAGAEVQFSDLAGATLCTASVSAPSAGSGSASCTTGPLVLSTRPVVARLLSGRYASAVDVSALAVAAVPSGSAAGGGAVFDDTGKTSGFAFRAQPGRKGSAPSGDVVSVHRRQADLGSGSRPYAFVVSTSSLSSLARTCSGKSVKVCSATIQGQGATTVAVDLASGAVTSIGGTSTIRIDAVDEAEPSGAGVPADRLAIGISGPDPFTAGSPSSPRPLTSGNIRVPA